MMADSKINRKRRLQPADSLKEPTFISPSKIRENSPSTILNPFSWPLLPSVPLSINDPTYLFLSPPPTGPLSLSSQLQLAPGTRSNAWNNDQLLGPISSPSAFPSVQRSKTPTEDFMDQIFLQYVIREHLMTLETQLLEAKKKQENEEKEKFHKIAEMLEEKKRLLEPVPNKYWKTTFNKSISIGSEKEISLDSDKNIHINANIWNCGTGANLKHLEILSHIRRSKRESQSNIEMATECRLCGNCSFATVGYRLAFMKQHLYTTHIASALYSCSLCSEFSNNTKTRVVSHVKRVHGAKSWAAKLVIDHRMEFDKELCDLAKACYGS